MRNIIIALCVVSALCVVGNAPACRSGRSCVSEYLTQDPRHKAQDAYYKTLYQDLLYPSVRITSLAGCGSGVVIASGVVSNASETQDPGLKTHYAYILTAAHVAGNEARADVEFFSHRKDAKVAKVQASILITDTAKDLALLRVLCASAVRIYTAKLAPRNYVPRIFTPVWVIGCSLGLSSKPTEGIITSLKERAYSSINHWGINAPIWPGNSGGGVFLKDTHELIGIVVWVRTCRGQLANTMGGIVPLDKIYEFLDENEYPDTACRDLTRCNDQRSNNE